MRQAPNPRVPYKTIQYFNFSQLTWFVFETKFVSYLFLFFFAMDRAHAQ